ncbi:MAG: hypothetical protein HRU20_09025 [Pseudomonadales bacterium]|nr:hypothetical protein [Pseudomonadales bacterium]
MQVLSRGPFQEWESSDGARARFECIELNYGEQHPIFLELNDHHSGVVILSNAHYGEVKVDKVEDLEQELPRLIRDFGAAPKIYWRSEYNDEKCSSLFSTFNKGSPAFKGLH